MTNPNDPIPQVTDPNLCINYTSMQFKKCTAGIYYEDVYKAHPLKDGRDGGYACFGGNGNLGGAICPNQKFLEAKKPTPLVKLPKRK